ncbi:MAG: HAD family hydrolase [Planctomycetes bacterium]|nr:HAD family hydrolase [Planctomycetota bacterium]
MPLTLEQYASYLDTRDLSWPSPPAPRLPRARAHVVPLPGLRAVIWNIYGTLLSISGGELVFEHPQDFIMEVALDKTLQEFKMWTSMSRKPGQPAEYLRQLFNRVLSELRMAPSPGERHPEIAAERIWEDIIKKLFQKDFKFDAGFFGSLNEFSRKVAYFFHASLQGTACYPGAAAALSAVRDAGLSQGVSADAQCFTLVQLQRGLTAQDPACQLADLIDPGLRALSSELGARKPSERLFRKVLDELARRDVKPNQVLHIGSRVVQDLAPARKLGMRTGLFAGDKESLQADADQLKDPATRPDVLLTELAQIKNVIG